MIEAKGLTKLYRLYKSSSHRLKEALSLTHKRYHREFFALRSLDFSMKKGEIVGVVGNNGSGKSTFLKLITGIIQPTSGSLRVSHKVTALLELGAGFNPEMSGLDNIYLHAHIGGLAKKEIDAKIEAIIAFADIGEFIYQPIKTYSSGMKARLAFALAIHTDPELLIIDEVLSVGDAAFARKCFAKIEDFKSKGVTILFVSHSLAQVVELCDRLLWLHRGQKVLEGETKLIAALYQKYGDAKVLDLAKVKDEYSNLAAKKEPKKQIAAQHIQSFNPNIRSKSRIEYEINGAKIYDIKVVDTNNNEANILYKHQIYYYTYKVKFFENFKKVNLAMLLKTHTTVALGGKELELRDVAKNKTYTIRWEFCSMLNSGSYFFNCGVNTLQEGKKRVLHRVIDAYMVQVPPTKSDKANNFIDFGFKLEVIDE